MAKRIAHPGPDELMVLVSFFDPGPPPGRPGLGTLTSAIKRAGIPSGIPIYAGTYGPNEEMAHAITALPSGRYTPLFGIQPGTSSAYYAGRRQRATDAAECAYAGTIPISGSVPLPLRDRYAWGQELGRRFRDALETARKHYSVATWQFDEILLEAEKGSAQAQYREFMTGILDGLYYGRPECGDTEEPGIVWYAIKPDSALPLQHVKKSPWLEQFWIALDRATFRIAGEEFPPFTQSPEDAATSWAQFQRLLRRQPPLGGDIRRSLGNKYVMGMTPGYLPRPASLGGNIKRWPRNTVNRWRNAFVKRRTQLTPVAGYGQFNLKQENMVDFVVEDAFKALTLGVRWNPKSH